MLHTTLLGEEVTLDTPFQARLRKDRENGKERKTRTGTETEEEVEKETKRGITTIAVVIEKMKE